MSVGELSSQTAEKLARLVATRKVSPVEIIDDVLTHIDALEPRLNALIVIDRDGA